VSFDNEFDEPVREFGKVFLCTRLEGDEGVKLRGGCSYENEDAVLVVCRKVY